MKEDKKKLILEKLKEIEELLKEINGEVSTQDSTPNQPPPEHPGKP